MEKETINRLWPALFFITIGFYVAVFGRMACNVAESHFKDMVRDVVREELKTIQ